MNTLRKQRQQQWEAKVVTVGSSSGDQKKYHTLPDDVLQRVWNNYWNVNGTGQDPATTPQAEGRLLIGEKFRFAERNERVVEELSDLEQSSSLHMEEYEERSELEQSNGLDSSSSSSRFGVAWAKAKARRASGCAAFT